MLGVGAYDGKDLIGLAACSADCDRMWQIGVDVLPAYRRKGVASALTETKHTSTGLTLSQLAQLMEALGCKAAYNLDGGQSSVLWFNGRTVSTPYNNGRRVGDIVYIADLPPAGEGSAVR